MMSDFNHALNLTHDGTLILRIPKGYKVDKVVVEEMETENRKEYQPTHKTPSKALGTLDCVDRQAAIDAVKFGITHAKVFNKFTGEAKELFKEGNKALNEAAERLKELPSVQPRRGKWTTEEVAEMLFILFGDECACNYNGIDEWLPERCKYAEIAEECPHPKEKHGCWMQFLLQGGGSIER